MALLKKQYSISEVLTLWKSKEKLEIPTDILDGMQASVSSLASAIGKDGAAIYGVNTGFGSLQNVAIPADELSELQRNLLITHAAGTGNYLPTETCRLMLLLKIINISKGFSAVSKEVFERLVFLYNNNSIPLVHEQGSLGASGDLAPLSEMCLPLLGMGKLQVNNEIVDTELFYKEHEIFPLVLGPKEALALINGTQFMLAHALVFAHKYFQLREKLPLVAALSTDVWLCRKSPYHPLLHQVRPHSGQIAAAQEMLELLEASPLQELPRPAVQDPYSFRCIPQVHGASYDAMNHCLSVWETELNSVTDNPIVFAEEEEILSGGNFHGQPLALTLDYAAMAIAELGNISERRTYLLISGQRNLPAFLSPKPGTDSGYMIAQYSAASIVSKNKQLCTPASVDSIVSSNGQEDHVSMGANAATKALQVMDNVMTVLSIEAVCACQAMNFREAQPITELLELSQKLSVKKDEHQNTPMHEIMQRANKVLFD